MKNKMLIGALAFGSAVTTAFAANLVTNGDFESCTWKGPGYKENASAYIVGWTSSAAGLTTPSGVFLKKDIQQYNNTVWVFLKGESYFQQDVTIATPGTYRLAFDYCLRDHNRSSASTFITLGNLQITNIVGDAGTDSAKAVSPCVCDFRVETAGTYTLKFEQQTTTDTSPAFDNIELIPHTCIKVACEGDVVGEMTPPCGTYLKEASDTLTCTASSDVVTTESGNYGCSGWDLYVGGEKTDSGTTLSTTVAFTTDKITRLVWKWEKIARITVRTKDGETRKYAELPDAVDSVTSEEEADITLAPGTYTLNKTLYITNTIALHGTVGVASDVTITASKAGFGLLVVSNAVASVKDLTISGGAVQKGDVTHAGGITLYAGLVSDCDITNCKTDGAIGDNMLAAGVAVLGGELTCSRIYNCRNNTGTYGASCAAVRVVGPGVISQCDMYGNTTVTDYALGTLGIFNGGLARDVVVTNNDCKAEAAGVYMSGGTLDHALVARNVSALNLENRYGGVSCAQKTYNYISNCTITANAAWKCGGLRDGGSYTYVSRTIIYGNDGYGGDAYTGQPDTWNLNASRVSDCCFSANLGGKSLGKDPLFVDAAHGDWRLAENSPASGMGYYPTPVAGIVIAEPEQVADVYVSKDGSKTPPYDTPEKATDDIVLALKCCADQGTLHVAAGDYPVIEPLTVGRAISIVGAGSDTTSVYVDQQNCPNGYCRVVNLLNAGASISGLAITNGYRVSGYDVINRGGLVANCLIGFGTAVAAYADYGGTISNCVIRDAVNAGEKLAAAVLLNSGSVMEDCVVTNCFGNEYYHGGSVCVTSASTVRRTLFVGNKCLSNNGCTLCLGSKSTVSDCLFVHNVNGNYEGVTKLPGGAIGLSWRTSGSKIINCTIANNSSGSQAGLFVNDASGTVINTILSGNKSSSKGASEQDLSPSAATKVTFQNCFFSVEGEVLGTGAKFGDPLFDTDKADWSLQKSSPCRNAGTNVAEVAALDLTRSPRINEEIVDMGAIEFVPSSEFTAYYEVTPAVAVGGAPTFVATVTGADLTGVEYRWRFHDCVTGKDGAWTAWGGSNTYTPTAVPTGRYTVTMEAHNHFGAEGCETCSYEAIGTEIIQPAAVLYLVPEGTPGHTPAEPYDTWETAATDMSDLVAYFGDGTVVTVAEGTHLLSGTISSIRRVSIVGVNRATSILRREGGDKTPQFGLLALSAEGAEVRNLTFSGGFSAVNAGGVEINGGLVSNCTFTAGYGRAVYNANGLVVDSAISGNNWAAYKQTGAKAVARRLVVEKTASYPHTVGNVVVEGGLFEYGRVVSNRWGSVGMDYKNYNGPGLYVGGDAVVRNTLVAHNIGNSSRNLAAGIAVVGPCVLVNCTIYSNATGQAGAALYAIGETAYDFAVTNCLFDGNFSWEADAVGKPAVGVNSANKRLTLSHCLVDDDSAAAVSDENFDADPVFRNAARGDLRIPWWSPCVDRGILWEGAREAVDLRGRARVSGANIDVGCYECPLEGTQLLLR